MEKYTCHFISSADTSNDGTLVYFMNNFAIPKICDWDEKFVISLRTLIFDSSFQGAQHLPTIVLRYEQINIVSSEDNSDDNEDWASAENSAENSAEDSAEDSDNNMEIEMPSFHQPTYQIRKTDFDEKSLNVQSLFLTLNPLNDDGNRVESNVKLSIGSNGKCNIYWKEGELIMSKYLLHVLGYPEKHIVAKKWEITAENGDTYVTLPFDSDGVKRVWSGNYWKASAPEHINIALLYPQYVKVHCNEIKWNLNSPSNGQCIFLKAFSSDKVSSQLEAVHRQFFELKSRDINQLTFRLTDPYGKRLKLKTGQPTIIQIELRKMKREDEKNTVNICINSEDSLNIYPENTLTNFSVILPSPIIGQSTKNWKISLLSLTCPTQFDQIGLNRHDDHIIHYRWPNRPMNERVVKVPVTKPYFNSAEDLIIHIEEEQHKADDEIMVEWKLSAKGHLQIFFKERGSIFISCYLMTLLGFDMARKDHVEDGWVRLSNEVENKP